MPERKYNRPPPEGDTLARADDQYGIRAEDIHSAIQELHRAGLLQLHDAYRDTYFLDPGPDHAVGEAQEDLVERVKRLEALRFH